MEKSTDFILSSSFSRLAVCSLSIKVLLRVGRYLPSRVPTDFREIKLDVTWSYVKRQMAKLTSEFVFFSSNPSLNHIKMSPTIRHKYKYFHSTVQRAKDIRQKFHFWFT